MVCRKNVSINEIYVRIGVGVVAFAAMALYYFFGLDYGDEKNRDELKRINVKEVEEQQRRGPINGLERMDK